MQQSQHPHFMLTPKHPGVPIQSDSQTSNSRNVAMNQTIKPACGKHQYYGWVHTSAASDKSAAHQRAWVHLIKDLQAIVPFIREKKDHFCYW